MNVLVIDTDVVGLDLCLRMRAYDHDVRWFIPPEKDGTPCRAGDGMDLKKVTEWVDYLEWADLIVPTMNDKHVQRMEPFRKAGLPIFGPSLESRRLEVEREFGMQVLQHAGIEVPEYEAFSDYDKAIAYVKKMDEAFVSKPLGDCPDKSLTYVAPTPEDLVYMLQRWKRNGKNIGRFMLQKKIDGTEFGVSRWMGQGGFIGSPNECFEYKKIMPGDMGVNTGETGTVMKYVEKSKIYDELLKPLERYLDKIGHRGDLAVGGMVENGTGKALPLEFTARRGWPEDFLFNALHRGDPAKWMLDAMRGKDSLKFSTDVVVGFLVWIPDFPYSHATQKEVEGIPIRGLTNSVLESVHFCSVMLDVAPCKKDGIVQDDETFCTTGDYVLVVDGKGDTITKARENALAVLRKIGLPNDPAWREDIADARLGKKIQKLQTYGYAREFRFS